MEVSEKTLQNRLKVGSAIEKKRLQLGYTQSYLASFLGVKHATISKIERGKWSVSIDYLFKICEILKLDITLIDVE